MSDIKFEPGGGTTLDCHYQPLNEVVWETGPNTVYPLSRAPPTTPLVTYVAGKD